MARKKAAEGENLYMASSPFGRELVSAATHKQAADRYIEKRQPPESTVVCVREGAGREHLFHYRKPRGPAK